MQTQHCLIFIVGYFSNYNTSEHNMVSFHSKSTAEEVAHEYSSNIKGKYFIVTGANAGLGLETVRVLCLNEGSVVLTSRDRVKGVEAVRIIKSTIPDADVTLMILDLSSFQSIRSFCSQYINTNRPLNVLINNAGIMATPKNLTADGLESQIGTNHFGHYLLTKLLLPLLDRSGSATTPSRIVTVSSIANYLYAPKHGVSINDIHGDIKSYSSWCRYGESKLANILHSKELTKHCINNKMNVISVSLHPGVIVQTELMRHVNSSFYTLLSSIGNLMLNPYKLLHVPLPDKNIQQGSSTSIYCAAASDVEPGEYYADCRVEKKLIHPKACDAVLAAQLWELSEKMIADSDSTTNK